MNKLNYNYWRISQPPNCLLIYFKYKLWNSQAKIDKKNNLWIEILFYRARLNSSRHLSKKNLPLILNLPQLNNRKEKGKKVEGGKKRKQLDLKTSIDLCRWCDSKIHRASVNYRFQSREIVSISNDICRFKFRSDGGRSLNLNL